MVYKLNPVCTVEAGYAQGTIMLAIIIYIGLFVWGMKTERLGWKPLATIIGIAVIQATVGFLILGGTDALRAGGISGITLPILLASELAIDVVVFFIGFGVGKFRRRGEASHDDVTETFS